ncbi:type II toxin-antitoxin system prevent-host-death family antitoxin [Nocardioides sp. AE5]|uniref:type II toxin-antitoxin system Phd/YefM family antitoxin n=1 Tax=Nocardioides sp. AE5 TaxID=2962573 RepID=UPI002880FC67|nr:type II toxin-antitoxin system prevent-host-death family antitoxin [Nocardioides sp. AE5]MDT0203824.1 type II toxin-antitoxin system prevent-host-death family antitoxin [Nocardioides sp. AE5]
MEPISQRDLRNDSADVLRRVEAGASLTITRRGVPVAVIGPIRGTGIASRPPKSRHRLSDLPRVQADVQTGEVLDDLRAGSSGCS